MARSASNSTRARARNGTRLRSGAAIRSTPNAARANGTGRATPAKRPQLSDTVDVSALELAADAVLIVWKDGTVACWSAGAERLFGYTREEMEGNSVAVLLPSGAIAKKVSDLRAQVLEGARVEPIETERVAKDGRVVTVRAGALPVRSVEGEIVAAAILYIDISEQKRAEAEVRASEAHYRAVVDALSEGVVAQDTEGRMLSMNSAAERICGTSTDDLEGASFKVFPVKIVREDGSLVEPEESPAMRSLRTGEPQRDVTLGVVRPDGFTRWIMANSVPLTRPGETAPHVVVSSFVDITEQTQTVRELEDARLEDLKRLALVSEYRDDETSRHTQRVARAAELLALALGMDREFASTIARAAPLHDVGKVGIPDDILLKPDKLTEDEFAVMMTHTTIGAQILAESDFQVVQVAMEIALTHHERWDGGGYPRGLRGEQIPLPGRIVAVVDAFDAMAHDRPYRRAVPIDDATAELLRCAGAQFDPRVVKAFLGMPHDALVDRRKT
jgi:putative two-component system response regulator